MSLREQKRPTGDSAPGGQVQSADSRPGASKAGGPPKMPPRKTWPWFLLILLANYWLMRLLLPAPEAPLTIPYTVFKEEVSKGNVEAIYSRGETITGRFVAPVTYPPASEKNTAPDGKPQKASEGATTAPRGSPKRRVTSRPTSLRS